VNYQVSDYKIDSADTNLTNLMDCPHCPGKNLSGRRSLAIHIWSQHAEKAPLIDLSGCAFKENLFQMKSNIVILRRIPQALRQAVADHLSSLINTHTHNFFLCEQASEKNK